MRAGKDRRGLRIRMYSKRMFGIFAVFIIAVALAGCSITGRTAEVFNDDIVGCSIGTGIAFLEINDLVQACHSEKGIYFVVENLGTTHISGMRVFLEADYNVTMFIKEGIAPGEVSQQSLTFGKQQISGIRSIRVSPMIGDSRLLCTNAAVAAEIGKC